MALALLGYFGTMVTALIVLMTLLNGALSTYSPTTKRQPYPMPPVVATATAPIHVHDGRAGKLASKPAASASREAAVVPASTQRLAPSAEIKRAAAAAKAKRLREARYRQRQIELARGREQYDDSIALGYAREPAPGPAIAGVSGLFEPFGSRRF